MGDIARYIDEKIDDFLSDGDPLSTDLREWIMGLYVDSLLLKELTEMGVEEWEEYAQTEFKKIVPD